MLLGQKKVVKLELGLRTFKDFNFRGCSHQPGWEKLTPPELYQLSYSWADPSQMPIL